MRSRILLLLLALVMGQAAPPPARAQSDSPARGWQGLQDLKPGKRVLVKFKPEAREKMEGEEVEGEFVGVFGTRLTLTAGGDDFRLEQRDIQSVHRLRGWSRTKAATIGAVILGLTGGYIGGRQDARSSAAQPGGMTSGLSLGVLAGGGLGALLGGRRVGELLYDAPQ